MLDDVRAGRNRGLHAQTTVCATARLATARAGALQPMAVHDDRATTVLQIVSVMTTVRHTGRHSFGQP